MWKIVWKKCCPMWKLSWTYSGHGVENVLTNVENLLEMVWKMCEKSVKIDSCSFKNRYLTI